MNSRAGEELDAVNCRKLRDAFEGREAIYIEKGVLRVRVTNIRRYRREIHAEVEEVPTKGLEEFPVNWHGTQRTEPRRWNIGAGDLTEFSDRTWHMGYGGWSLFFAPEVVSGLTSVAAGWPPELDAKKRYKQALRFLLDEGAYEPTKRVSSKLTLARVWRMLTRRYPA